MTAAEFIAWDEAQHVKHEFVQGEVYAMTGARKAHVTLAMNLALALRQHLRGTPCRAYISDMKLRVEAADAYFYPDVVVSCSAADAADPKLVREPVLVVEVLSPSTAAHDRGAKFAAYRMLPSLREYLVIDPVSRHSDLFRLTDGLADGGGLGASAGTSAKWVLHPSLPEQAVTLASVGLMVDAATLWDEVPIDDGAEDAAGA